MKLSFWYIRKIKILVAVLDATLKRTLENLNEIQKKKKGAEGGNWFEKEKI